MEQSKPKTAFQLPKMTITEKWESPKELLKELENAKSLFVISHMADDSLKVGHSGMDENIVPMLMTACHRNTWLFELLKLVLINIEQFRNGELDFANELMNRLIEYIRYNKTKNLTL